MFGFGEGHGDRIEALEGWKKDTEPWGSRINTLENWKSSADTSLKNLEGSRNEISSWQTKVDKWRATTDGKLGRIERKKLDVSDYEKERDQRDEKHRRLRESCDAAFPAMERRMHTVEKEVARLRERTGDIEKAVHKWKAEKLDEGGNNGCVSISGGDPRRKIYMIQQQGYQLVPDIPWVGINAPPPPPAPIYRCPVYQTPYDPIWSRYYRDNEDEEGSYNEQQLPNIRVGFSRTTPGGLFKKEKRDQYHLSIGGGGGAMSNRRRKRRSDYRF